MRRLLFSVCVAALLIAAPAQAATKRLRTFASCTALVRYAEHHVRQLRPAILQAPTAVPNGKEAPAAAGAETADGASTTNVQEAGVDEPDIVKGDGRYLFVVSGGQLRAVDARAATPAVVGSLVLPDGYGHELLLRDGRALVISQARSEPRPLAKRPAGPAESPMVDILPVGPPQTILTEVDVRDPAAMKVVRTMTFDGLPLTARLTGDTARVVVTSTPPMTILPAAARKTVAGWVPKATLTRGRAGTRSTRPLVPCRAVRRTPAFTGTGLLTVLTIDLSKGLPAVDTDALMTDAQTVYASTRSLYVATQRWDAGPSADTAIHQFDATARPETTYRGSGTVPGHLLNQFALSEHEGVLRAASTEDRVDGSSESFVTTLRAVDGELARVGQVGGLGRDERIYAVRFLGPVGYVVTFRQTDPLYTIDLSRPAEPRVAGELKILGYSAYLHPVGDGLLLGVGRDAGEDGRVRGLQLSLFDVSDPARPVRLQQRLLAQQSASEAEYDHHAFLWWPTTKLAVLPLMEQAFNGAAGFRVDRGGIDEVGRVAGHDGGGVRRTAVVGDRLFSVSDSGVVVSSLATLAEQGWIPFPATLGSRVPEPAR